jgi:hypothetical protein
MFVGPGQPIARLPTPLENEEFKGTTGQWTEFLDSDVQTFLCSDGLISGPGGPGQGVGAWLPEEMKVWVGKVVPSVWDQFRKAFGNCLCQRQI